MHFSSYFVYHLDLSWNTLAKVHEDCLHDNDMIRAFYVEKKPNIMDSYTCTLEEELKPPALRQSVSKLIQEGRKEKEEFDLGDPSSRQVL